MQLAISDLREAIELIGIGVRITNASELFEVFADQLIHAAAEALCP